MPEAQIWKGPNNPCSPPPPSQARLRYGCSSGRWYGPGGRSGDNTVLRQPWLGCRLGRKLNYPCLAIESWNNAESCLGMSIISSLEVCWIFPGCLFFFKYGFLFLDGLGMSSNNAEPSRTGFIVFGHGWGCCLGIMLNHPCLGISSWQYSAESSGAIILNYSYSYLVERLSWKNAELSMAGNVVLK